MLAHTKHSRSNLLFFNITCEPSVLLADALIQNPQIHFINFTLAYNVVNARYGYQRNAGIIVEAVQRVVEMLYFIK